MTPHADGPRFDRWLIYIVGCSVFVGIFYFCLRFLDASVAVSFAVAIPVGIVSFLVFAKVMENTDTPPGFWDNSGS